MGLRDLQTIFHRLQNVLEHAGGVEYLNTDEGPVGVVMGDVGAEATCCSGSEG